jgi:hypothetical protein
MNGCGIDVLRSPFDKLRANGSNQDLARRDTMSQPAEARELISSNTRAGLGLGTQSGGFQKMCGLISATLFNPSIPMMRSISVWKISSAR